MFLYEVYLCFYLLHPNFLEQSFFLKVWCYNFSKKFRHNWEIRADWENAVYQLLGLFNILIYNIIHILSKKGK